MNEKDLIEGKKIMVKILLEIDRICCQNNIDYWIGFGTLLGAVRHKGFIPWDDDIDILMPRNDYNKFAEIVQDQLDSDYFFQNKQTDKTVFTHAAKVRHKKSIYYESGNEGNTPNGSNGIFVDIFPAERIMKKDINKIIFLTKLRYLSPFKPSYTSIKTRLINYSLFFLYPFRGVFKFFIKKCYVDNGDTSVCGYELPFQTPFPFPHNLIYPIKKIKFEGNQFNCPQHNKTILEYLYGDYMKLPPVEKRRIHAKEIKVFE